MHWSQLHTILWLRWRLTRNQWSRGGRLNFGISIGVTVLVLLIGLVGGLGGLLVAIALTESSPLALLGIYDTLTIAFLFLWMIGVISTIQRSESIDIGKLLHLPISLRGVFLLNYLASHVTASLIVYVPWMMGLALGLAMTRRWAMIAMVPLTLGFLFMVTAWTYHLRGWLVILMRNPRRYHAVVAGITIAFMLLGQLPNLFVQMGFARERNSARETHQVQAESPPDDAVERDHGRGIPAKILLAHKLVPPLWVGYGAMSLAEGSALPAVLAAVAAFGIGSLGLGRAYRSTCRFYEGQTDGTKTRIKEKPRARPAIKRTLLERRLPGLSEEAAALALASLRSLTRATEVKMALGSNMLMLIIFGGIFLFSRSHTISAQAQFLYGTGAALLPFLGITQLMANQFGFDRAGFRALVLSPAPRAEILLGKNLAVLPIAVLLGVVYLTLAGFALHLRPIVVLAGFVQLLTAFLLICILGNLLSSLLPYRVREGGLAPTKTRPIITLLNIVAHLTCMAALSLTFIPAGLATLLSSAGGPGAAVVNLLLSIAGLAALAVLYRFSLPALGQLLQQREQKILRIVTEDVE
jgi:ABC-2 type transport system permease protein